VKDRPPEFEDSDCWTAVCCHARTTSHALGTCEA
jgi:hypothetical protein